MVGKKERKKIFTRPITRDKASGKKRGWVRRGPGALRAHERDEHGSASVGTIKRNKGKRGVRRGARVKGEKRSIK